MREALTRHSSPSHPAIKPSPRRPGKPRGIGEYAAHAGSPATFAGPKRATTNAAVGLPLIRWQQTLGGKQERERIKVSERTRQSSGNNFARHLKWPGLRARSTSSAPGGGDGNGETNKKHRRKQPWRPLQPRRRQDDCQPHRCLESFPDRRDAACLMSRSSRACEKHQRQRREGNFVGPKSDDRKPAGEPGQARCRQRPEFAENQETPYATKEPKELKLSGAVQLARNPSRDPTACTWPRNLIPPPSGPRPPIEQAVLFAQREQQNTLKGDTVA